MYNTIPVIHHDLLTNKSESNKIIKPLAHSVSPSNSGWLRGTKNHVSLSLNNTWTASHTVDRDSSVGIATCSGLDGMGNQSRWGEISAPV